MNREFVDYNTALELKELGFNENCFASYTYDRHNEGVMVFDIKEQNGLKWSINTNEGCKEYKEPCTAPLYQQVFRWFREKHRLNCFIVSTTDGLFYYYRENMDDRSDNSEPDLTPKFKTYEEAQQLALVTLIEIAKNK